MFDETKITEWVQKGLKKEAVDEAFVWGWNFVCPNHTIRSLKDKVRFTQKRDGRDVEVFNKPYDELDVRQRDDVVNANKSDSLTTSQIRIVFGEMRRIQMNGFRTEQGVETKQDEKVSFIMLRPKLAYAVKRHNKKGLTKFYDFFLKAHNAVDITSDEFGEKQFINFMHLLEAVLAYHKFHGGKE